MLNRIQLKYNVNKKLNDVRSLDVKHVNKSVQEHPNLYIIEKISMYKPNFILKNSGRYPSGHFHQIISSTNLVIASKKPMSMSKQMPFLIDHHHLYSFHNPPAKILPLKSKMET